MTRLRRYGAVVMLLGAVAGTALAQTAASGASARTPRERGALEALERMGAYLRGLKAFQVNAAITTEDVLDDGEKVQYASDVSLVSVLPNRLRARITSDRAEQLLFYDGTQFTLYDRRPNYFATVKAPATLAELIDRLDQRYGIEVPLADLFLWGKGGDSSSAITAAQDLGDSEVAGVTCGQYAFRQPGVDWQIWIQRGDFPLPRKLVITTTTDEARPQHVAVYQWNLAPSVNDAAFTFDPPEGARRIVFSADAAAAAAR